MVPYEVFRYSMTVVFVLQGRSSTFQFQDIGI